MSRTFAFAADAFSARPELCSPRPSQKDPSLDRSFAGVSGHDSGGLAHSEAGSPTPSKSVLIVSADDYLRSTMRSFLEHVGFTALGCMDVRRAAQIFFGGSAVDLLLVDAHTLGSDGVALAGQCSGGRPGLPVIVLSGPGPESDSDRAGLSAPEADLTDPVACRAWRMLRKPVLLPALLGIIRKALEPRKPPQAVVQSATVLPFPPPNASERSVRSNPEQAQAAPIAMKRRPG